MAVALKKKPYQRHLRPSLDDHPSFHHWCKMLDRDQYRDHVEDLRVDRHPAVRAVDRLPVLEVWG